MRELRDGPLLSRLEGTTAVLTLHRPEARNAIDRVTRALLLALLLEADSSEDVRVVVLTGTDPAFCAGVDFKALADTIANGPPPGINPGAAIRAVRKPILAAVNGACVTGGLELALSCDFVIASELATFADTHARHRLTPNRNTWGMTALLAEAVGRRRAKELSLTGRPVSATEAVDIGIASQVVPHDQLLSTALLAATAITKTEPLVAQTWLDTYDAAAGRGLEDALTIERATALPDLPEVSRG